MKKILIILLTIILLGCMDKTDERGFYIEGEKIGYHKETKTLYDKEGYDQKGWNKEGINKETGTLYDKDGFDQKGWNKEGINKETNTNLDKDGFNQSGWNKKGINKETGYNFDKEGRVEQIEGNTYDTYILTDVKNFKNIKTANLGEALDYKENALIQVNDEFYGNMFMSLSFFEPVVNLNISLKMLEIANALSSFSKKSPNKELKEEMESMQKKVLEALDTAYLDIYTAITRKDAIESRLVLTFSSLNKISDIEKVEFLIKNNIYKLENIKKDINIQPKNDFYIGIADSLYVNQLSFIINDELFELLAKLEKYETISIKINTINNDEFRFKWINDVGLKNKYLLPISLGKYYILKKTLNEK